LEQDFGRELMSIAPVWSDFSDDAVHVFASSDMDFRYFGDGSHLLGLQEELVFGFFPCFADHDS